MRAEDAIILAAGMGARLRPLIGDLPKGLIEIGGEPLVGRSIRLLRDAGIRRVTIVVGHGAGHYEHFARGQSDIELIHNPEYATTGSMASLAHALEAMRRDVLVLESDLIYEPRALTRMVTSAATDSTLASGLTGAGDEVWVYAPGGRLAALSKNVLEVPVVDGEFVGITRLSAAAGQAMRDAFDVFVRTQGHARMDYETGGLVAISCAVPVTVHRIDDLRWGEIDDERQFERVVNHVWPALNGSGWTPPARQATIERSPGMLDS